ncbi:MAG TPA: hypothetical protein VMS55_10970 [Myxococcota bacterium]|nr:hypothetical protein [Myxococcota bacterium]
MADLLLVDEPDECNARAAVGRAAAPADRATNPRWGALHQSVRYDAQRDAWDVEPDLSSLRDEAYGAAPHEMRRRRE